MGIMGIKTKLFIILPLIVFAAIIYGFATYNTLCKNSNINLLDC